MCGCMRGREICAVQIMKIHLLMFQVKRCLLGGVIISGLVLASFLVYVDNFTPYFQQTTSRYYTTRRFTQNSTTSRHLVSQNNGSSSAEKTRTYNQTKTEIKIVINNNVTTVSPEMFKEILAQNRHKNQSKDVTTEKPLANVTRPTRTTSSGVNRTTNSTQKSNKLLINIQNSTSPPTVLNETKHFDRPNPDLSGYVAVPNLKTVSKYDIRFNLFSL